MWKVGKVRDSFTMHFLHSTRCDGSTNILRLVWKEFFWLTSTIWLECDSRMLRVSKEGCAFILKSVNKNADNFHLEASFWISIRDNSSNFVILIGPIGNAGQCCVEVTSWLKSFSENCTEQAISNCQHPCLPFNWINSNLSNSLSKREQSDDIIPNFIRYRTVLHCTPHMKL